MINSIQSTKKPVKRKQNGFVYVATNSCYERRNIYKIGYAKNIKRRMQELSTGQIFRMYPVLVFRFDDCRKMEKQIHKEYKEYRIKNVHSREYFRLTKDMVVELKYKYQANVRADYLIDEEWISNVDEIDLADEFNMMFDSYYRI